ADVAPQVLWLVRKTNLLSEVLAGPGRASSQSSRGSLCTGLFAPFAPRAWDQGTGYLYREASVDCLIEDLTAIDRPGEIAPAEVRRRRWIDAAPRPAAGRAAWGAERGQRMKRGGWEGYTAPALSRSRGATTLHCNGALGPGQGAILGRSSAPLVPGGTCSEEGVQGPPAGAGVVPDPLGEHLRARRITSWGRHSPAGARPGLFDHARLFDGDGVLTVTLAAAVDSAKAVGRRWEDGAHRGRHWRSRPEDEDDPSRGEVLLSSPGGTRRFGHPRTTTVATPKGRALVAGSRRPPRGGARPAPRGGRRRVAATDRSAAAIKLLKQDVIRRDGDAPSSGGDTGEATDKGDEGEWRRRCRCGLQYSPIVTERGEAVAACVLAGTLVVARRSLERTEGARVHADALGMATTQERASASWSTGSRLHSNSPELVGRIWREEGRSEEGEEAQGAEFRSRDQLWRTLNVCGNSGDELSTGQQLGRRCWTASSPISETDADEDWTALEPVAAASRLSRQTD
ncbi:hypothetical protein THAOC_12299, partial [Thalassiosira oceanica]